MSEVIGVSISELRQLLQEKKVSAVEVVDAHLDHIANSDGKTNAFLCTTEKLARDQAESLDGLIREGGELPPLAGATVSVKDNICVEGYPTTCASKILQNFQPPYNATAAERIFAQGAICLGKGNLDEYAMGSSTENSAYGVTRNPWDLNRVPGGSSGGPTVSVAAGYSQFALGSDTGGSIRQPASLSGIVGIKPTYGLVSRFGLVAYASSLDQIGPLTRSVEDAALVLSALIGHDPKDSTSLHSPFEKHNPKGYAPVGQSLVENLRSLSPEKHCRGLKIGILSDFLSGGSAQDVADAIKKAMGVFESLGAEVREISLSSLKYAVAVYYIVATAEASANLARFDGVRYGVRDSEAADLLEMYLKSRQAGFGDEVKRRIMLGTYALSSGYYDAYYKKAQQVRRLMKDELDRAFADLDLLMSPTSPTTAFELGEKMDDPLTMYLDDIATIPANLAGLPGISIPCGQDSKGLPIGLQLLGPQLSDSLLLKTASAFEKSTDFGSIKSPFLAAARVS